MRRPRSRVDGGRVAAVVDQAQMWVWNIADGSGERVDDGRADFVFDPEPDTRRGGRRVDLAGLECPGHAAGTRAEPVFSTETGARPGARRGRATGEPSNSSGTTRTAAACPSVTTPAGPMCGWVTSRWWTSRSSMPVRPGGPGQRSYALSPDGERLAFTRNESGFGRLCVVDTTTHDVIEVARGVHGQLTWVGERLAAIRSGARTPTQVVCYDTSTWARTVVAVGPVAGWESADLPEPELVEVEHGDVILHARRYVAGQGRTICWLHGGPTDQWQVDFRPRFAYWWSTGWDILVPDPRGTTGHGRAYQQALLGEWGRRDVDDTAAILRRTTPTAGSRGAHGDDGEFLRRSDGAGRAGEAPRSGGGRRHAVPRRRPLVPGSASHRFEAHYTVGLVGPAGDGAVYRQRSPVNYAAEISTPLLIMHGDADPVVPLARPSSWSSG